jgi:hypothetical protein
MQQWLPNHHYPTIVAQKYAGFTIVDTLQPLLPYNNGDIWKNYLDASKVSKCNNGMAL